MTCAILLRLTTSFSLILFFLSQVVTAATEEANQEWVLKQRHNESGEFDVYVAPQAVKIVSFTNSGIIVAKGPDWKVVCFRRDDKTQWTTNLNKFQGLYSTMGGLGAGDKAFELAPKMKKVASGIDHGMPYSSYTENCNRMFWLADGIKTSPKAVEVICRYFSLPGTEEVILRLFDADLSENVKKSPSDVHSGKQMAWGIKNLSSFTVEHKDTAKIQTMAVKKIAYNAADFDYPKNFKQVPTLNEVLFSKSQQGDLVDFINDLGFTSQPKSKTGSEK